MSVKSRLPKIKKIAEQAQRTVQISKYKGAWGTRSLRNEADNYRVTLEWIGVDSFEDIEYKIVHCECQFIRGIGNLIDCQGNSKTICYHALGCLMGWASLKNKTLVLFDSFKDALCHSNFGCELIKIVNEVGGYCWGTVIDKAENGASDGSERQYTPAPNDPLPVTKNLTLQERVDLIRPEDDFID